MGALSSSPKPAIQNAALSALSPGVSVGGDTLTLIYQLCEMVPVNKNAARHISQRCKNLCASLEQYENLPYPKQTVEYRDHVFRCLNQVKDTMTRWDGKGRLYMLTHQADFKADLDGCDRAISECLLIFTTVAHMEGLAYQWEEGEQLKEVLDVNSKDMMDRFASPNFAQQVMQQVKEGRITEDDQRKISAMIQRNLETVSEGERKRMAENLYKLLESSGRIPPECQLSPKEVEWAGERRIEDGNNIDMYKGRYLHSQDVRIKVIRGINMRDENNVRRIRREVEVWVKIYEKDKGKHIIPFYGFYSPDGLCLALVSPWMKNGNALSYVKKQDDVKDIYKKLILEIAEGIEVLHSMFIVHGNLRAENVLIGDEGQPLITDFALAKLEGNLITQTTNQSDSCRWCAPEIFEIQAAMSAKGDIYSFGMTILELFTHEMPYPDIKKSIQVVFSKGLGELPKHPIDERVVKRGLDDRMWQLLCLCWSKSPSDRPTIGDLVKQLGLAFT
ncbi:kinase-like domain-containing protein [Amanita rubescens]|nr:kinase-like domain-containing protein [Amanita rubescens]